MTGREKIAIVGPRDMILPFKAIGFEIFPVQDVKEAREKIKGLIEGEEFALIFVTSEIYKNIQDFVVSLSEKPLPAISEISTGEGRAVASLRLRELVKRAVGVDIFKE